jgi:hypothetical protein
LLRSDLRPRNERATRVGGHSCTGCQISGCGQRYRRHRGAMLRKPHATIQPGWFAAGSFASLVDFDSYWHLNALREVDKFCTDDIPQFEHYRALGYFQHIPAVAHTSATRLQVVDSDVRHRRSAHRLQSWPCVGRHCDRITHLQPRSDTRSGHLATGLTERHKGTLSNPSQRRVRLAPRSRGRITTRRHIFDPV